MEGVLFGVNAAGRHVIFEIVNRGRIFSLCRGEISVGEDRVHLVSKIIKSRLAITYISNPC